MANYADLTEHIGTVVVFVSLGWGLASFLAWQGFKRLERKVDELGQTAVKKNDFKEWKEGRTPIWNAINTHSHAPDGEVIRSPHKSVSEVL